MALAQVTIVDNTIVVSAGGSEQLEAYVDAAAAFSNQAQAAAEASGVTYKFYDTKAAATADLASIPANAVIEVFVDESQSNNRTRYRKESGVLVFKVATLDADLQAIANLTSAANKVPYATGSGTWALADLTSFARTLLATASNSAFLTALGQIASTAINFVQTGTGGITATLAAWILGRPVYAESFGAVGDGSTDDTTAIQNALTFSRNVILRSTSGYKITSALTLLDNQSVTLAPGVVLRQYTAGTPVFTATSKTNVWINLNGGTIYGPGGYSSGWTNNGNAGHRGIRFLGCTYSGVTGPGSVVNFGNAQIDFTGGSNLSVIGKIYLIGTNAYGGTIATGGNFQQGVFITNDTTYGTASYILLDGLDVSNTAQGVLIEAQVGVTAPTGPRMISNCDFHDIPGQHAIYNQDSFLSVSNVSGMRLGGSVVKIQSADANRDLTGFTATGIRADTVAVSVFEIATVGTGSLNGLMLSGVGKDVGYGISINGKVSGLRAEVNVKGCGNGLYAFGANMKDCHVHLIAENCTSSGVIVSSTSSVIDIWPTIRNANTASGSGGSGVRVNTASGTINLHSPFCVDSGSTQVYGLFSDTLGSTVNVRGYPTLTNGTDYGVRAVGTINFPANYTVSGTNGQFLGTSLINFENGATFAATSSGSTTVLRSAIPLQVGTFVVEALVVSNKTDDTQQKGTSLKRTFTYDGTTVLAVAATVETVIGASGTFDGTYSLNAGTAGTTGANTWNILVSNTGGGSFDWKMQQNIVYV